MRGRVLRSSGAKAAGLLAVLRLLVAAEPCRAQEPTPPAEAGSPTSPVLDYFRDWFPRVSKTQAEQPHWVTPLVTVTPRLEQEFRYDQIWQSRPNGQTLNSFGGGKGLELIPTENTEVILGIPAWQSRNNPEGTDGFADENLLLKYRLLAENEERGNYILTLFAGFTLPTGSKHNTADHALFTPTIAFGKGWGDADAQATLGASVPDNAVGSLGTPLLANATFLYRFRKVMAQRYLLGPAGNVRGSSRSSSPTGIVIGRQRVRVTVGAGFQIAVTERPVYDNSSILLVRFPS
jgi:hypothetical protein